MAWIALILGAGLIAFVLYLLPYAYMNAQYEVPIFIEHLRTWLQDHYGIHQWHIQITLILLPMFVAGCLFLYLSKTMTHYVDIVEHNLSESQEYSPTRVVIPFEAMKTKRQAAYKEPKFRQRPMFILISIILILIALILIEWALILGFT